MTLKTRMYGHSLSAIEKELIFSREDTGFVRPIHASGAVFYLDPSPFLQTPKREVYIAHCPPPGKNALIQATGIRSQAGHHERSRRVLYARGEIHRGLVPR